MAPNQDTVALHRWGKSHVQLLEVPALWIQRKQAESEPSCTHRIAAGGFGRRPFRRGEKLNVVANQDGRYFVPQQHEHAPCARAFRRPRYTRDGVSTTHAENATS